MDRDQKSRFEQALLLTAPKFDISIADEQIVELTKYYEVLSRWNERLHLVAPCEPEEFAQRHVLESLVLLRFLPKRAQVIDVGSGGGLPIIPCLIVRNDLTATLIESSQKKSIFLREACNQTGINQRGTIISQRFADVEPPQVGFVTSRALDDFINQLSTLVQWAPEASTLLLFGGENLKEKLDQLRLSHTEILIPKSEKRFLFAVKK